MSLILLQIIVFLLEVLTTLVGGACLLRMYMRWTGVPFNHPLVRFVHALSDWLVVPLQKVIPLRGRVDAASLLAAWGLKLVHYALLLVLMGAGHWAALPVVALLGVAKLAVSAATALVIVAAVLSWTQSRSPLLDMVQRLCGPLLAPVRKLVPLVGGVDLSPVIVVVAMQVLSMLMSAAQDGLLAAGRLPPML
ncbi:YggT family protein [Ottowia sp.]|uniref:YggT family protein n=1 Tax=Ottowia sp. TaxID=1898956 RepID=UPI003A877A54